MADNDGAVLGQATARIRLDSRGAIQETKAIITAGRDMTRALVAASREVQAARKLELEQLRQATIVMRTQHAQVTAAARIAATQAQQAARATAQVQIQQARAAANAQIEEQRRVTAAHRAQLRGVQGGGINLGGIGQEALGALGIGLGIGGAIQMGRQIDELTKVSAQADRTRQSYTDLARGVGQSGDEMLAAMKRASGGLISDADLILNANRAMIMGVADTSQELTQLLEVAQARGRAVNLSTTEAFSRLAQGIGKREIEILDELGIVIKLIPTYEEYARAIGKTADELTEAEKSAAIFNKVIADSQKLVMDTADAADLAADKFERQAVAAQNLKDALGSLLQTGTSERADFWAKMTDNLTAYIRALEQYSALENKWDQSDPANVRQPPRAVGAYERNRHSHLGRPSQLPAGRFDAEQGAVVQGWAQARSEIERSAYQESTNATRQYEQQRAATIRQYEQSIAREAQDFAVARQRAATDHAQAIAEVREQTAVREVQLAQELARTIAQARSDSADRLGDLQESLDRTLAQRRGDSAERVAEWEEDVARTIEERRKDGADRLLELEKDFAANREQAQRQYQLTLAEAASRGDGRAVYQLQQRFALESEAADKSHSERVADEKAKLQEAIDQLNEAHRERLQDEQRALDKAIGQAKDAHNRQVADEKEALEERIAQAQEAHARQLEEARIADEQRIIDMQADFDERLKREDADRATRLGRLAQDHSAQLRTQDSAHAARLSQIQRHAAAERAELDEQAKTDLLALGVRNAAWIGEQTRKEAELEKLWDQFMEHVGGRLTNPLPAPGPGQNPGFDWRRQQLEAERTQLLGHAKQHAFGTPQYIELTNRIYQLELELQKLGWTPPAGPGAAAAMVGSISPAAIMAASRFTVPAPMSAPVAAMAASAGGVGGGGLSIDNLSVVVNGAPTESPRDFAEKFQLELLRTLRAASNAYRL